MKRSYLIFFVIFMIAVLVPIKGNSMEPISDKVRVGLFHGSLARSTYRFYSDTGFKLGCKIDNNIVETIDFSDKMLEVCTVDAKDFVSIKNNMNKNDALDYAIQLSKHGTENYLFFDGSWSVWTRGLGESKLSSSNLILVKGGSKGILLPSTTDKPIVLQNIQPEGVIAIEDRRYRGALEMMLTPEGCIQVINELGLEEYLYGVIPKEMPPNWHVQALKAQAVTARTYTLANLSKWRKQGFDIDSNTSDQVYYGFDAENPNTNIAVDETRGEIICFEGKPIEAFYHSDSGGLTEECKDVFVSDLPYLKSVEDIFYSNSPNSTWEVSLSIDEISNRVKSVANVGKVCDISIFERTPTGRVKKLIVKGSEGEIILEKNQIRNVFGLKSTFFDVLGASNNYTNTAHAVSSEGSITLVDFNNKYVITQEGLTNLWNKHISILGAENSTIIESVSNISDNMYIFRGRGYGHGVGMSQWGAKAMAENGYNYKQILLHYYKNVEILQSNL